VHLFENVISLPNLITTIFSSQDEEGSSTSDEDESQGYSVSIPGGGTKKVKINTSQLEEKSLAARALYEHARALGKDFDSQCVEVRSAVHKLSLFVASY
jgi:hypothetical protein